VKPPVIPDCEPWSLSELLEKEKELVGIYLSAHPLDSYRFEMEHYNFVPIAELERYKDRMVRIAGFVTNAILGYTKSKGDPFGKIVLNDYSGHIEIAFWNNNFVKFRNFISKDLKLMITGRYGEDRHRPGVMKFEVDKICLLEDVRKLLTRRISIRLRLQQITPDVVSFLSENIRKYQGNTPLVLHIQDETDEELGIRLRTHNGKIELNDEFIRFLQEQELEYGLDVIN
jgi:DNA polymerase-3 subunit alpha